MTVLMCHGLSILFRALFACWSLLVRGLCSHSPTSPCAFLTPEEPMLPLCHTELRPCGWWVGLATSPHCRNERQSSPTVVATVWHVPVRPCQRTGMNRGARRHGCRQPHRCQDLSCMKAQKHCCWIHSRESQPFTPTGALTARGSSWQSPVGEGRQPGTPGTSWPRWSAR
jgi:hypothetical protein